MAISQDHSDRKQKEARHRALISLRQSVGRLHNLLKLNTNIDLEAFFKVLDCKLLTQLDPDYPLMVAISGGGSTGKSSLFNALVGKNISAVQAKAGLSRRVLAAIHPDVLARPGFLASLFEAFGADPEPLGATVELTIPGIPKYVVCPEVPSNLVLLDTPDFDTGDRTDYVNRGTAKPILEACDILLYIFTNATYNNLSNTQFIRHVLTDVGNRKVMLIYRCSRAFTDEEVAEHSAIVTRNIYGPDGERWCLGIYRINEDDAIAKGDALMEIRPIGGAREIKEVLRSLDRTHTRADFIQSALGDLRRDANKTLQFAKAENLNIELYGDAVRVATSWAVTKALQSYPQAELIHRFAKVWERGQPRTLKIIKSFGKVGVPFIWAARKVRDRFWRDDGPPTMGPTPESVLEKNLREAANELRRNILGETLAVEASRRTLVNQVDTIKALREGQHRDTPRYEDLDSGKFNIFVDRPLVLEDAANRLKSSNWITELDRIAEEARIPGQISDRIEEDLATLATKFRADMTWKQKVRETFTAALNLLPALGAVTYIVFAGDPVTGSTIYAKLTALFGFNDLWALTAIPASIGLKAADRHNLEKLLSPIFAAWFNEKAAAVFSILEKRVAGEVLQAGEESLRQAVKPLEELNSALANMGGMEIK